MKLFFVNSDHSDLADEKSYLLLNTREALLSNGYVCEVGHPELADAIIIQEKNSYKDFRYIEQLLKDSLISKYTDKVFTINNDDCATGLLRGLYTSIPRFRFKSGLYAAVPYMEFPNELIYTVNHSNVEPLYLASWRGNTKSNKIRKRLVNLFQFNPSFQLEATESWLNHGLDEKRKYVDLIDNAKFSLCPAGWAPVSFRIYESMALGRCPVIIADNFVPPKGPNWHEFALFCPERELNNLESFLLQYVDKYDKLGEESYRNWHKYFGTLVIREYYASTLLFLIQSASKCSRETEVKRWRSLSFYWSNEWTIPQRVANKMRRIAYSQA